MEPKQYFRDYPPHVQKALEAVNVDGEESEDSREHMPFMAWQAADSYKSTMHMRNSLCSVAHVLVMAVPCNGLGSHG
jgi:hypothetical protein